MRRVIECVAVCGVLCGMVSMAKADYLYDATLVEERAHLVDVHVEAGAAHFKVRRTFHNAQETKQHATMVVNLPPDASVIGLRVLDEGGAYEAELVDASKAIDLYTDPGGDASLEPEDRPRALFTWFDDDRATLHLFPVQPGGQLIVEYDLVAPATYADGKYLFSYPKMALESEGLVQPSIRAVDATLLGQSLSSTTYTQIDALDERAMSWCHDAPNNGASCHVVYEDLPVDGIDIAELEVSMRWSGADMNDLNVMWVSGAKNFQELEFEHVEANHYRARWPEDALKPAGKGALMVFDSSHATTFRLSSADLVQSDEVIAQLDPKLMRRVMLEMDNHFDRGLFVDMTIESSYQESSSHYGVMHHDTQSVMYMNFDLPPQLTQLPEDLDLSIVLDASYSMETLTSHDDLLIMLDALGDHMPDASIDLIVTHRTAQRVFDEPVEGRLIGKKVREALDRGELANRNGSNLEQGIRLAEERLVSSDASTRRILVLTDEMLPPTWSNARRLDSLEEGILLQIVKLLPHADRDLESPPRSEMSQLGTYLEEHLGGAYLLLNATNNSAGFHHAMLGVLRPTSFDALEFEHPSLGSVPVQLREGEGLSITRVLEGHEVPDRWTLRGKLWQETHEVVFEREESASLLSAALALGDADSRTQLLDGMAKHLARKARVVSPDYSLFAVKRSRATASSAPVAPDPLLGMRGMGGVGCGGFRIGKGAKGKRIVPAEPFKKVVEACLATVRPRTWSGDIMVKTTYHEIIDVNVSDSVPLMARCVEEGIWQLALEQEPFKEMPRKVMSWNVETASTLITRFEH